MKKTILTSASILIIIGSIAQNINIPDTYFKKVLLANTSINTNADLEIQITEAESFEGILRCSNSNISDLTGIEAFVNITYLYCDQNNLTTLDIKQNTALEVLNCSKNDLDSLDLSTNTALTKIWCYQNNLTILNITQNVLLLDLNCRNNNLEALDLSENTSLTSLVCQHNNFTAFDLSKNTALEVLEGDNNPFLTELNLKNIDPNQTVYFNITNNKALICITVDDVALATTTWTRVDAATNFSTNCTALGISDKAALPNLSIFPNPAHSQLTIETDARTESVTVINLTGEKKTIFTTNGSIDVSDLAEGVYFLQTEINGVLVSDKFTKE